MLVRAPPCCSRLPEVPLPQAAAGIRIGGAVTAEAVLAALRDGLRLATLIICIGAANVLANPKRLLMSVPGALYELAVAVTVALSVAPQLVQSALRVHRARRLRGDTARRTRVLRDVVVPVASDALDRSLLLAAAMDSRGHGRRGTASAASTRLTSVLVLGGLVGVCVGTYGTLDETVPRWLGLPMLALGVTLGVAGFVLGGRRVAHTRYRPDPWRSARMGCVAVRSDRRVRPDLAVRTRSRSGEPLGVGSGLARAPHRRGGGGAARRAPGVDRATTAGAEADMSDHAVHFDQVTITYPDATHPVLRDVELSIPEGELCLVVGHTGAGKSTLLGAVNGLVPHFSGGLLRGRVTVEGRDTEHHPPRELADVVGVVGQDPLAGFVTDVVEDELAYAMEQLAVPPAVMRKRVEETLDLLGIAELRRAPLADLSGGQQQRVAIGSVLTPQPRILVLDEPTSALDPTAAEEVLAAVTRLVHDLGVTVIMAEHRLERVAQYADRVIRVHGDGTVTDGAPTDMLADTSLAPPVARLAGLLGWSPVTLSVRDARRRAGPLRERLAGVPVPAAQVPGAEGRGGGANRPAVVELTARSVTVRHGAIEAVRGVDLDLRTGEVTALMGRNGSGKSSLLWALQGTQKRRGGTVDIGGRDPATLGAGEARSLVGLVPQSPSDLLYLTRVTDECSRADAEAGVASGTCRELLDRLVDGVSGEVNPRDLSEGQRLALALAVQLTARPAVVLLDEPTRGLDYRAKARLGSTVVALAAEGHPVVVATHDVEFVADWADRVVVMAEGEIVADGPTPEVVVASAAFAPQVAKVLHPEPWLTVAQVGEALGIRADSPGAPS